MKRQILFAGLLACALGASAQTGYMKDITVSGKDVQRQGNEVVVRMNLDLSGIRNRALKREEALTGNPRYTNVNTTIRRKNGEPQSVDYQATAPFEKWMYDGRLEVREAVTGCAECDEGGETSTVDPLVLPRFIPNYVTALREPAPEPVKRRDEVRSARLQYRQDSYTTDPKRAEGSAGIDRRGEGKRRPDHHGHLRDGLCFAGRHGALQPEAVRTPREDVHRLHQEAEPEPRRKLMACGLERRGLGRPARRSAETPAPAED